MQMRVGGSGPTYPHLHRLFSSAACSVLVVEAVCVLCEVQTGVSCVIDINLSHEGFVVVQTACCRLPTADARPRGSMSGRSLLRFVMDRMTEAWVLLPFQVLTFLPVSIIPQAACSHFHLNVLTCIQLLFQQNAHVFYY
jgi:hypothetical protein